MKRISILLVCLLMLPLVLTACGNGDAPEGHILASNPEKDGFSLYIPKEWNYNTTSGILSAYPSSISTANLTVAYLTSDEPTVADYWAGQEGPLKEDFADFAVAEGYPTEKVVADRIAYVYEYTGTYIAVEYRIRQYLVLLGNAPKDGMYVITYTASNEKSVATGNVDFESSLEQVETLIGHFKVNGTPTGEKPDLGVMDENTPEGMKRANQFAYLGMNVYVPKEWHVYLSDGYIAATTADGKGNVGISNIDLTGSAAGSNNLSGRFEHYGIEPINPQGTTLIDYWNLLKAEYNDYFENFTVLSEPVWEDDEALGIKKTPPTEAGESSYYVFSFSGTKYGKTYVVTQYLFRETSKQGMFRSLTYTTVGQENHIHLKDMEHVLEEVTY